MQCSICMCIDVDNKKTSFHLWKEGYASEQDEYICETCLEGIKDIRRKCHHKSDNPAHAIFNDYIPWFAKQIPGMEESFKKEMASIIANNIKPVTEVATDSSST